MRITVVGGSGFVGSAVLEQVCNLGHSVDTVPAPRLSTQVASPELLVEEARDHLEATRLAAVLSPADVMVNAAGIADATSGDASALQGANGLLPAVLAEACRLAGIPRLIHISSAAVQGRRPLLDESLEYDAFTPYVASKVLGEQALLEATQVRTVIYRPTSVHGASRSVTQTLTRVARSPLASVARPGDRPTPQIMVESVASAVAFLCEAPDPALVVMHPWEGVTTGELLSALGKRTPLQIPDGGARRFLWLMYALAKVKPGAASVARRLEMLWFGQRQATSWLQGAGWSSPTDPAAWHRLGEAVQTSSS